MEVLVGVRGCSVLACRMAEPMTPHEDRFGLEPDSDILRARTFEACLRRAAELARDEPREFALALISVDRFDGKLLLEAPVADRHVATIVETILRTDCGDQDAWVRLDLKRFNLLLPDAGLSTAHVRAERLMRRCEAEPVVCAGHSGHFTVSIGVASFPHTARDAAGLIAAALEALEHAVRRGGNQVALAGIPFEG